MNGAIAEPLASTRSTPKRTSVITIGASQYFLFSLMNCQSSETTCAFDISTTSKHFFVVTRILLPFRIRAPVAVAGRSATIQWIPSGQTLEETNGRRNDKKNEGQNNSRGDKGQALSHGHPGLIGNHQGPRHHQSQSDQHSAQRHGHRGNRMELPAIHPPQAQQNKHAADDETEFAFGAVCFPLCRLVGAHSNPGVTRRRSGLIQEFGSIPDDFMWPKRVPGRVMGLFEVSYSYRGFNPVCRAL